MCCTAQVVPISAALRGPPLFSAPLIGLLGRHGRRTIQLGELDYILASRDDGRVRTSAAWYQIAVPAAPSGQDGSVRSRIIGSALVEIVRSIGGLSAAYRHFVAACGDP